MSHRGPASKTSLPRTRDDLLEERTDAELLVYDSANRLVHVLNDTAAAIFDLCDGQHDLDAIEKEIRLSFHASQAQNVRKDILETLERFSEKHLLS